MKVYVLVAKCGCVVGASAGDGSMLLGSLDEGERIEVREGPVTLSTYPCEHTASEVPA